MAQKTTKVVIDCCEFKALILNAFHDGHLVADDLVDLSITLAGKTLEDGSRETTEIGLGPLLSVNLVVIEHT